MMWQYKVSLALLLVAWLFFLIFAAYHTDSQYYISEDNPEVVLSYGYTWIWYHFGQWSISLIFSLSAAIFGLYGLILEIKKSDLKIFDFIKIEIISEEESES